MKKYLITSAAALALCGLITSCSHDIDGLTAEESVTATYEKAFITAFGQPAPDQTWGFGPSVAKAATRTITVNGDAYSKFPSKDDVNAYFPKSIPGDADDVSELETKYQGKVVKDKWGNDQTLHNIYHIYAYKIVEGYNLKITHTGVTELGGSYQNSAYDQTAGKELAHPYNVYVDVDGDVTIRRNGATHFNLYILRGNVTLESNYGEQAGLISVASGATLNDQRNSIAANQGVKIFNKGIINATNAEKYDIGNFCTVYNEGKFNVTGALTYSPGDANDSYFMNLGDDAELTAPSMTLNSTGNFFNSGKTTIAGETNVTQARLYWVNAGHYTTGSMRFSAKNTTFYNYCQLIVTANAHMYDGEFNLMTDSYTEAGSAEFDNFFINMYGNTGMHIKGAVRLEAQGDGTYQGFKNKDNSGDKYLLIDGKVTIASHKYTFSIQSGITYSINSMDIIKDGNVVTEDYLKSIGDGDYPVTVLEGTKCPYGELKVTPNTDSCGANWNDDDEPEEGIVRVIAEDLTVNTGSDFDFNDVVFDVWLHPKFADQVMIKLRAAGGTLPLYIGKGKEAVEVHEKFGRSTSTMINTGGADKGYANCEDGLKVEGFALTNPLYGQEGADDVKQVAKAIKVVVIRNVNGTSTPCELLADQGEPTAKLCVGTDYKFTENGKTYYCLTEGTKIHDFEQFKYHSDTFSNYDGQGKFSLYVKGIFDDNWYKSTAQPKSQPQSNN